jgi:hypothetical protein
VNTLVIRTALVACGLAMLGTSLAVGAAQPAPITADNACSILMGGGGAVFASDDQNNKWFLINRAVSQAVADSLQGMGYRIEPLIVDIRDNAQRMKMLGAEVTREKCNRIIQIAHGLSGESKTTPGMAANFDFDVSVLGVTPDGKLTGISQKTYSYPLTKQVMETLSMSEVGKTIAADIDKAHVIDKAPTVEGRGHDR